MSALSNPERILNCSQGRLSSQGRQQGPPRPAQCHAAAMPAAFTSQCATATAAPTTGFKADLAGRAAQLGVELTPVHSNFGLQVSGLDLREPLTDAQQVMAPSATALTISNLVLVELSGDIQLQAHSCVGAVHLAILQAAWLRMPRGGTSCHCCAC